MASSRLACVQVKAFSDCLHEIYAQTPGENPVECILDALERLMRVNTLAADEMKGDGTLQGNGTRLIKHTHLGSRHFDGFPGVRKAPLLCAHDHPMILHVLKHGHQPALRMSDFVTQRQLRTISLYEFDKQVHEWRDQVALVAAVAGGTISIALNRDRVFTERVLNRCALFKKLPGNEQLTARERKVFYWIMQGKRDEEIAVIVKAAPRTINKHVCSVLGKPGVENRASAITTVLEELKPAAVVSRT